MALTEIVSCIASRQIMVGDSKYMLVSDPLLTVHFISESDKTTTLARF